MISVTDTAGDGTLSYNNSTGVITYAGISDSQVRSKLSATSPISYNTGTGAISFSGDTDDVSEGSTNLYFSNSRARGAISVSGSGISYDSGTGVITLSEIGDIESVTAGDGLSGGGNSGAVSLAVDSTVVRTSGTQSIGGAKTFTSSTTFSDSIVGPGSAVLFNANAKLQSSTISDLTTTNLSEGTNLYYTDTRARAAISVSGDLSYNSSTGVISFTNDAGDIESVTAGVGLSGGGSSGAVTLDLDFSELTDMTGTMDATDEFIILDSGTGEKRKAANEIGLSVFNNDSGFTTNAVSYTHLTLPTICSV